MTLPEGFPSRVSPLAHYPVAPPLPDSPPPPFQGRAGGVGRWGLECAAGTHSEILLGAGLRRGCMPVSLGTQGHGSLGRVPFPTMGVMAGCLWPRRGPRRYSDGLLPMVRVSGICRSRLTGCPPECKTQHSGSPHSDLPARPLFPRPLSPFRGGGRGSGRRGSVQAQCGRRNLSPSRIRRPDSTSAWMASRTYWALWLLP